MRGGVIRAALDRSRNAGDSRIKAARRLVWAVAAWCLSWRIGLRAVREPQLGSHVLFEGERWQVVNFAWQPGMVLRHPVTLQRREGVDRRECRQIRTPRELWHRVQCRRSWWVGYWLDNWVDRRIDPEFWRRFDQQQAKAWGRSEASVGEVK